MDFNIKKMLEGIEGVAEIRLLSSRNRHWDKVKLRGIDYAAAEDTIRKENLQEGILYVLSEKTAEKEQWAKPFEAAGCAGVILLSSAGGDDREPPVIGEEKVLIIGIKTSLTADQLTKELSNRIICEAQDVYEDLVDTNRYLFSNTLNKQDIGEMLEYFKNMIGNPVAVFDGMFHCLYTTDDMMMGMKQPKTLPKTIYMASKYLNRHFVKQRVRLEIDGAEREVAMISFPVSFQGKIRAYLSIPQVNQEIRNLDFPKIEMTASAIMGQMKHDFALHMAEERNIDSFLYNAICRKDIRREELMRQARSLGLNLKNKFVVLVFDAECSGEIEEAPQTINHMFRYSLEDKMFLIISSSVKKMGLHGITGLLEGKIVSVFEMELPAKICKKRMEEGFDRIRQEFGQYFRKSRLQTGMGNIAPIWQLEESFRNAKKALSYGVLSKGKDCDFSADYEDSLLLHLIGNIKSKEGLEELIPASLEKLEEYDRKHNTELLDTLSIYFNCNCNMKKSAQAMTIHYKTMVYRMNQISGLCETDFSNSDVRLRYGLGIKLFQLLKGD